MPKYNKFDTKNKNRKQDEDFPKIKEARTKKAFYEEDEIEDIFEVLDHISSHMFSRLK